MFTTRLLPKTSEKSDIALEVYSSSEEKKEEKQERVSLPKISRDLWIEILNYCSPNEAVKLGVAVGTGGQSLLKSYVYSHDDLTLHSYFPLSKPNASAFQGKLHQVIRTENQKLRQEKRKRALILTAIAGLSLSGYGASGAVLWAGKSLTWLANPLYPEIELFVNGMKKDCTHVFVDTNHSGCIVTNDKPCVVENFCKPYDCNVYDSHLLKCTEPPYVLTPYASPLFFRLEFCSPLYVNYTEICKEVNAIVSLAIPYYWGTAGVALAATLFALGGCTWQSKKELVNKPILPKLFSLAVSFTEKEKLSYIKLMEYLHSKDLTVAEVTRRIEVFIDAVPGDYQRCSFFREKGQSAALVTSEYSAQKNRVK